MFTLALRKVSSRPSLSIATHRVDFFGEPGSPNSCHDRTQSVPDGTIAVRLVVVGKLETRLHELSISATDSARLHSKGMQQSTTMPSEGGHQ
jgi:hypothetical protein